MPMQSFSKMYSYYWRKTVLKHVTLRRHPLNANGMPAWRFREAEHWMNDAGDRNSCHN